MKMQGRARAREKQQGAPRGVKKVVMMIMAFVLALGGTGIAVLATSSAATAAEQPDPDTYPYNVTFVWKLAPGATTTDMFKGPQTLIANGHDPSNPHYIPAFAVECEAIFQIDHYRITNDAERAIVDGFRDSKTLTSGKEDGGIGGNWETEYGETYWDFVNNSAVPCDTGVDLAAPAVNQAACTEVGDPTVPTVTPVPVEGIDYRIDDEVAAGTTVTVIATAKDGVVIEKAEGWVVSDDKKSATYSVTLNAVDCKEDVTPVAPTVNPEVCTAPGESTPPSIVPEQTPGIDYSFDASTVVPGGTVVVTATAQDGFNLLPGEGWNVVEPGKSATFTVVLDDVNCTVAATPVAPTVEQAVCTAPGQGTPPSVTVGDTVGITYEVTGTVAPGESVTVTATPLPGYFLSEADGWTLKGDGTATYELKLADVDCDVTATPVLPTVEQAVCTVPGEPTEPSITLPETAGIDYSMTGTVAEGQTVVVTATPQEGFILGTVEAWVSNADGSASTSVVFTDIVCEVPPTTPPVEPTPPPTPPVEPSTPPTTPPTPPTPPVAPTAAPSAPPALPVTGSGDSTPVLGAGFALVALGALVVVAARRKKARA